MDAKTAMKARMREAAQKRGKKIDSPLVRYNDLGQPVCKVCNIAIKAETLWPAHVASRQHKAAVDELKAKAAAQSAPKAPEPPQPSVAVTRPSSSLPEDFFDSPQPKRANQGAGTQPSKPPKSVKVPETKATGQTVANGIKNEVRPAQDQKRDEQSVKQVSAPGKGSLPEGFFDSVDADHRARGLEPPKLDIKDEYKEFRKLIKEDMVGADVRLEEEEAEAAEEREERELLEQRTLLERIDMIKQRKQERLAAAQRENKREEAKVEESSGDSSDESEEEEDTFLMDWRAKTL
ncbi:hypothetical protein R1sor_013802 [Riccia sorocarpa]|uniref:Zinc finger protein 830 n=1 Tax=Riccia sorocarpa TaxID=122646 RepID=A0ABD3H7R9_9MARC